MQKTSIQDSYLNVLEMLDQQPGSEQILNALIQLESDIKSEIFDILQNYQQQGKKSENTKIYQAIHDKNFQLRNKLESRIMQIVTGDKVNIDDLLEQSITNLNNILENQESIEDMLQKMKIYFRKVKETILPPDEQQIQTGSGNGWIEKKEGCNKFGLLITLLRNYGVYTDDLYVVTGVNQINQMREQSYLYIHIPRINKTILINNGYGEKTFIYDGYIEINYFLETTKIGIKNNGNIVGVNFDYDNIENWKSKMRYYLFEKGNENKAEGSVGEKINIKDFLRAPEGWYTNKALATNLSVAQNTIKNIVNLYRKSNPEYFKNYLDKRNHLNEYYSPGLCKIIEEEIKNRGEESPEGWFTNNALAEKLGKNKDAIKKISKKYIITKPQRFKEYINKFGRIREYYHPELCKVIEEEIKNRGEKAPEGWKNNNKLASDLGVDFNSVKKIAESYRGSNLNWFGYYLDNINNLREYYAPELCKIVEEEIEIKNRGEKSPEGWKNNNLLRLELKEPFYIVKYIADKYRNVKTLWFKKYLDNHNNLREYYSPELCKIIEEEIKNRGEKAPKGRNTNKGLSDKIVTTGQSIKLVIEKYRKTNPERFKEYLDKMNRKTIHYSPELCKIIEEEIKNRGEKAPKGRDTNKGLAKKNEVDPITIKLIIEKYRKTNPERFKEYLDKMNRKTIHYSPELCEIIRKELQNKSDSKII